MKAMKYRWKVSRMPGKWILMYRRGTGGGGLWICPLHDPHRSAEAERGFGASQAQVKEFQNRMQTAEAQEETLARQAGMTKKELACAPRSCRPNRRPRQPAWKKQQKAQISEVTRRNQRRENRRGRSEDRRGITKADLEATKAKLQSAIGDLGVQSGLIAPHRWRP